MGSLRLAVTQAVAARHHPRGAAATRGARPARELERGPAARAGVGVADQRPFRRHDYRGAPGSHGLGADARSAFERADDHAARAEHRARDAVALLIRTLRAADGLERALLFLE